MSVHVDVVFGPARSGKTHRLVDQYAESLKSVGKAEFGSHLWIAPSSRSVTQIRESLAEHGKTHLSPGVTTFANLSNQIIFAANVNLRPISAAAQRELLRRTIATALTNKRLAFFAKAATRNGFIDMLAEHFSELRQRDIRPDAYQRVANTKGESTARRELALLFAEYDRQLTEHGLCDIDDLYGIARDALASKACRRFDELKLIVVDGFTDFTRIELQLLEQLANRSEQLCVSLPTDEENAAGRDDLFAKTAATLAELKELFPRLEEHRLPARATETPVAGLHHAKYFSLPPAAASISATSRPRPPQDHRSRRHPRRNHPTRPSNQTPPSSPPFRAGGGFCIIKRSQRHPNRLPLPPRNRPTHRRSLLPLRHPFHHRSQATPRERSSLSNDLRRPATRCRRLALPPSRRRHHK